MQIGSNGKVESFLSVFFIFLLIFSVYALAETPIILSLADNKILEKPIRAELILKIGSDKENEDFYKIPKIAIGGSGQIYILDTGNSRILCFSREGNFLFSFGRRGQGPGELSDDACNIKILSDGNIYVIDNRQRRINVYNQEGKFLYSAKTSGWYNDIVLLNNVYYLTSTILKEGHKPVHISRKLAKIDDDFGIFVEPAVGILKQISQLPMPEPWRYSFHNFNFARLVATKNNELIFSQGFPYRLIKYDAMGNLLKDIMGEVDFDTYLHVKFIVDKFTTSYITDPPRPVLVLLNVSVLKDTQLAAPFLNPEKGTLYIDIYDLDLNLLSRYRITSIIADMRKEEYVLQTLIDNDYNLYAVIYKKNDYPMVVKYKLNFD